MRGPLTRPQDIVLVGIDDDSFQNLDLQWPWPRRLHAELLASLSAARARVVVFDVLFDTHSNKPDDDRLFSEAIAAHPNVILATARTITKKKTFTKVSWLDPVPTLMSAVTSTGCIELLVDPDGAEVSINVGGVEQIFTLDRRGRARNETDRLLLKVKKRRTTARFRLLLKHGSFAEALADEGLVDANVRKIAVLVPVTLTLGGNTYVSESDQQGVTFSYTAHEGRGGVAKSKKKR